MGEAPTLQVLWIPGQLPSLNDLLYAHGTGGGGSGNSYARLKRKWTDDIALLARVGRLMPVECVRLRFTWREKDRRRDPDNVAGGGRKLILDGLVRAKVLKNDGWDEVAGFSDIWEIAAKPGVLVLLETVVTNRGVESARVAAGPRMGVLVSHGQERANGKDESPGAGDGDGGGQDRNGQPPDHPDLDR